MNKKGFTLVEVLAIITVISLIAVIVLPNIGGSIESKKEKELNNIISMIENSGKTYFSFNSDEYKVDINKLINEEYIVNDLLNPITNEKMEGCVRKTLDKENVYQYTFGSCSIIEVPFKAELNGGTPSQSFNTKYDEGTIIELKNPTKENFEFKEWKVVKGNSILKGNTLTIGTTDTEIYAIYESWPTLEVDLNGGSDTVEYKEYYKSGSVIELEVPTKTGYTFNGWTIKSGNGIVSGNTLTMGTKNTVIEAKYNLGTYKISYELNGGSVSGNPTSYTVETETFTLNTPTKTGYTFTGWFDNSEFNGTAVTRITQGTVGNKAFYAKWMANTYTLKYNANGGSGTMSTVTHTYGVAKALTANTFTRSSYKFNGWNTKADGTGASYSDKQSVSNLTSTNGATITLYAQWVVARVYLFNSGDQSSITGGWIPGSYINVDSSGATISGSSITINYNMATGGFWAMTNNKIDVTNYSKLCFEISTPDGMPPGSNISLGLNKGVLNDVYNPIENQFVYGWYKSASDWTSYSGTATVSLVGVSGSYNISLKSYGSKVVCTKIYLE